MVEIARPSAKRIKKFYKTVSVEETADGFAILLDGRRLGDDRFAHGRTQIAFVARCDPAHVDKAFQKRRDGHSDVPLAVSAAATHISGDETADGELGTWPRIAYRSDPR